MTRDEFPEVLKAFATDSRLAGATWDKIAHTFPDPAKFILVITGWNIAARRSRSFTGFWMGYRTPVGSTQTQPSVAFSLRTTGR
jgi:hypothetical protein